MKVRQLLLAISIIAVISPAYAADEGMTVVQALALKWTAAFNSGNAKAIADLYSSDAVFLSGVLGVLKGKTEIENALAKMLKQSPKITFTAREGHENGNVVWGYWDYAVQDGPAGYGGITAVKETDGWHITQHISNVKTKPQ